LLRTVSDYSFVGLMLAGCDAVDAHFPASVEKEDRLREWSRLAGLADEPGQLVQVEHLRPAIVQRSLRFAPRASGTPFKVRNERLLRWKPTALERVVVRSRRRRGSIPAGGWLSSAFVGPLVCGSGFGAAPLSSLVSQREVAQAPAAPQAPQRQLYQGCDWR
jgi:hypothetical protein